MKNILLIALFFISIFIFSCKSKTENAPATYNNDSIQFFQLKQFIESQINDVNKTPYFIYKIEVVGDKQDSTPINNALFNQYATTFLNIDLSDKKIKKYYKESTFEDESTKSFTINYSTQNKDLELQNLDIILDKDGETVKRILARKFINYKDSSAIEQLSWKPGERFMINRAVQLADNKEIQKQLIVVWNEKSTIK